MFCIFLNEKAVRLSGYKIIKCKYIYAYSMYNKTQHCAFAHVAKTFKEKKWLISSPAVLKPPVFDESLA